MHPYIPHLLDDITAAYRAEIPEESSHTDVTFEEKIDEVEKLLQGEVPTHTFGYYCGLEAVNFPPPHQLTGDELKTVIKAFGHMMSSWNLDISLPEKLPLPIAYSMTVDTLDKKIPILNSGIMCFDYCTGYAPDCIFKEYCPCLKISSDKDNMNDVDLP